MTRRERRESTLQKMIAFLDERLAFLEGERDRLSLWRMLVFLGGIGLGIFVYLNNAILGSSLMVLSLVFFTGLVIMHRRLDRSVNKHRIWREIKSTQYARMMLDWDGIPEEKKSEPLWDHPYEMDLDITGPRSISRLLDITISREGYALLNKWLLNQRPDRKEALSRQAIIRELVNLPGFRENLLLQFKLSSNVLLDGQRLLDGLRGGGPSKQLGWLVPALSILGFINVLLFAGYSMEMITTPLWIFSFVAYLAVFMMNQEPIKRMFNDAIFLDDELDKVRSILTFLESYPYPENSRLAEYCRTFYDTPQRPSAQMKRIRRLLAAIGISMNPLARIVVNIIGPWDFFCAARLESAKADLVDKLPQWLDKWSHLEALISLANVGWLYPEAVFPVLLTPEQDVEKDAILAVEIRHPLIPAAVNVPNDCQYADMGDVFLITGSNMAGKSTFLKTLGVNLILAFAGAPVYASALQTQMFAVFSSIKVSDSITSGFSYFYAEVRRLRALLERLRDSEGQPLFFLIDEIFRGTNNRERYIGSRSYIRALVGQNGVGAISTHDLDLTKLGDEIAKLTNVHFREEVVDGKMVFDYKLQQGPCPTTNALVIMELEGLPVDKDIDD